MALAALVVWSAWSDIVHKRDTIALVVAGQALIKIDPRQSWDNPFGSVRPIIQSPDVAFTNFEMAVLFIEHRRRSNEDRTNMD